jgi:hypothetical protein
MRVARTLSIEVRGTKWRIATDHFVQKIINR